MILFSLLILILIFGVVYYIIEMLPLPPSFKQIAQLIVGLIVLLVLLGYLFVPGAHGPFWR